MGMFEGSPNETHTLNRYPWVEEMKKAMWHGFWTVEKFSFESDIRDFKIGMNSEMRQVVLRALAVIAQVEVKVKTFWVHLDDFIKDGQIIGGGIVMGGVEEIHNDAYKRLYEVLGLLEELAEAMNVPALKNRVGYLTKHAKNLEGADPRKQFVYSLALFTMFVEYVSLFVPFMVVLWMNREHNVLKDTAQQVKYTRNEETIHAQFGMNIIAELRREYPELFDAELEARFYEEAAVAVACEDQLIDWIMEGYHEDGLNADLLKSYVRIRMNEALEGIGYRRQWLIRADHEAAVHWMKVGVLAPAKVDFFHGEPTGYVQADRPDDEDDF